MGFLDFLGPIAIAKKTGLFKKLGIGQHRSRDVENRLRDWQGLTDAQLKYFSSLGGADAEAANQILSERANGSREADVYRNAIEKASYAQLGPRFTQGLSSVQGRLAGMGPLADSGAATALKARLASSIYNTATGQITGSYADILKQRISAAQQYRYQSQLLKQQKQQQKKSPWQTALGIAGGVGGALVGGPTGAYAGYNIGSGIGGYPQQADNYANFGYG